MLATRSNHRSILPTALGRPSGAARAPAAVVGRLRRQPRRWPLLRADRRPSRWATT